MDTFQHCEICTSRDSFPKEEVVIVATFPQNLYAKEALLAVENAHIIPFWQTFITKEEIEEKYAGELIEAPTLLVALHGIKDIVHVQTLYTESIFQQHKVLTYDVLSQKAWEKYQKHIA